jgi:hypothetical protein
VRSFEKHWVSQVLFVEIVRTSSGVTGFRIIYLRSTQSGQNLGSTGYKLGPTNSSMRDKTLRLHLQLHLLRFNRAVRPCLRSSLPTYSEIPKRTHLGLELLLQQQVGSAHNSQAAEGGARSPPWSGGVQFNRDSDKRGEYGRDRGNSVVCIVAITMQPLPASVWLRDQAACLWVSYTMSLTFLGLISDLNYLNWVRVRDSCPKRQYTVRMNQNNINYLEAEFLQNPKKRTDLQQTSTKQLYQWPDQGGRQGQSQKL